MITTTRRHDIDWVRVIAIGLLLVYHVAIGFQPWGIMIGFIATEKTWESVWIPMSMLNIWRIPLLFFVSGMGVYFAILNRTWVALIKERAGRILIPFLFGTFAIVPIHLLLWRYYYKMQLIYSYNPAHLWFLGNIFVYVLLLSPAFYFFKKNDSAKVSQWIKKIFSHPLGLLLAPAALTAEAMIVKPYPYELYAMTWHGFFLGLVAFFFGFCFVLSGEGFWKIILKGRWLILLIAIFLFVLRFYYFKLNTPVYLLTLESSSWIYAVFAFAHRYLNRPSKVLSYLSQAAYPVYIIHMIFLFLGSLIIFPLELPAPVQYLLLLVFTIAGCLGAFEFVIRRVKFIRPLFGLKM